MLPIIAVVIVILFIAASLAVDIARMHVTRSELRTATDAAARAASEALGREQNTQAAIDAAIAIAGRHRVAGKDLTIEASDVTLGSSFSESQTSSRFRPRWLPVPIAISLWFWTFQVRWRVRGSLRPLAMR